MNRTKTHTQHPRGASRRPAPPKDPVEQASEDSFPASDPPSFTPVRGNTRPDDEELRHRREAPPQQ